MNSDAHQKLGQFQVKIARLKTRARIGIFKPADLTVHGMLVVDSCADVIEVPTVNNSIYLFIDRKSQNTYVSENACARWAPGQLPRMLIRSDGPAVYTEPGLGWVCYSQFAQESPIMLRIKKTCDGFSLHQVVQSYTSYCLIFSRASVIPAMFPNFYWASSKTGSTLTRPVPDRAAPRLSKGTSTSFSQWDATCRCRLRQWLQETHTKLAINRSSFLGFWFMLS